MPSCIERWKSAWYPIEKPKKKHTSHTTLVLSDRRVVNQEGEAERGKFKDRSASLRDGTNYGAASASIGEAKARKVIPSPERADRENKK